MPGIIQEITAEIQQEKDLEVAKRLLVKHELFENIKSTLFINVRNAVRHGIKNNLNCFDLLVARDWFGSSSIRTQNLQEIFNSNEFNEILIKLNADYNPVHFKLYWKGFIVKDIHLEVTFKETLFDKFVSIF